MRTFPKYMIMVHPTVGGLGLGSLELEQMVEAVNLFISLYLLPTLSSNLICDSLELM